MAHPAAPGSDLVSPVDYDTQNAANKLVHVGARTNGLPTGTAGVESLVMKAYDLVARGVLRRSIIFDAISTVQGTRLSNNGAVVQFNLVGDLDDDPTSAALLEDYDVLPTPMKSWGSSVTVNEYGRVVTQTALFRGTTAIPFDPIAAERVARNAAATMERLAFNALIASGGITNTGTAGGAVTDVTVAGKPSDTFRAALTSFKTNNVEPFANGRYLAVVSPAGENALRKETDAAGWRYWQANSGQVDAIANGYVGTYEGFDVSVSNIPGLSTLGGLFIGQDALGKAFSAAPGFGPNPSIELSPVVDRLRRFVSVGWYWLGGYGRFRSEAVLSGNPAG